jgi:hypothetical protein
MGDRCLHDEMNELSGKISSLRSVLNDYSGDYHVNIVGCRSALSQLKQDSWTATESERLKTSAKKLDNIPDNMVTAHNRIVTQINIALRDMESEYDRMNAEDDDYHSREEDDDDE